MTDAERNAAAGGHPVGDCEDCGKLHTPWSAHFNEDGSRSAAEVPVWLTQDELAVLHDVLRRVLDGAQNGEFRPLRDAALFTLRPQFATALGKIGDAALAAVASQKGTPA